MALVRAILPGMVARGHGVEALCLYLRLTRAALFDLIVELGLASPHERPLRKAGGRSPWPMADTSLFIVLWMAGWHAESLGQRFGRSAGSVWAKARQLGLPRRDRTLLFRPENPSQELPGSHLQARRAELQPATKGRSRSGGIDADGPRSGELPQAAPVLAQDDLATRAAAPRRHTVQVINDLFGPTPAGTPPGLRTKRLETPWTRDRDIELGQRWWARQHYKSIARDMGISPSAVQSRRFRLGLP